MVPGTDLSPGLTSSGGHQSMYGGQGGRHSAGMLLQIHCKFLAPKKTRKQCPSPMFTKTNAVQIFFNCSIDTKFCHYHRSVDEI